MIFIYYLSSNITNSAVYTWCQIFVCTGKPQRQINTWSAEWLFSSLEIPICARLPGSFARSIFGLKLHQNCCESHLKMNNILQHLNKRCLRPPAWVYNLIQLCVPPSKIYKSALANNKWVISSCSDYVVSQQLHRRCKLRVPYYYHVHTRTQ